MKTTHCGTGEGKGTQPSPMETSNSAAKVPPKSHFDVKENFSMQTKLEQCRDILKSIPTEDGIRIEAMQVFQEVLSELNRLRLGVHRLNGRELEVFELIGCGLTTKEIGPRLHISPKTVETYRDNIREKLRVQTSHRLSYLAFHWMMAKTQAVIVTEA
jgi:DNA-binding NarL/FixJ family response regulator